MIKREPHQCILDSHFVSEHLNSKISDISYRMKQEIQELIEFHPEALRELIFDKKIIDWKRDFQFIINLALINWKVIRCLPEIQYEKQVALHVLRFGNDHFELERIYIDNREKHELFSDKEWILQVFRYCTRHYILLFICSNLPDILRKDKEIALIAGKVLNCLEKFDESIKSDREIVLEIVKDNGMALRYADRTLWNDYKILSAAVRNNILVLGQISNVKFLKYWIGKYPLDYKFLSEEMKRYPDLALIANKKGVIQPNELPEF